jgi:hypothetical protein
LAELNGPNPYQHFNALQCRLFPETPIFDDEEDHLLGEAVLLDEDEDDDDLEMTYDEYQRWIDSI